MAGTNNMMQAFSLFEWGPLHYIALIGLAALLVVVFIVRRRQDQ